MQVMTLFNPKVHGFKLKTIPSSVSQREKEKNSFTKLDIIEIGVMLALGSVFDWNAFNLGL